MTNENFPNTELCDILECSKIAPKMKMYINISIVLGIGDHISWLWQSAHQILLKSDHK